MTTSIQQNDCITPLVRVINGIRSYVAEGKFVFERLLEVYKYTGKGDLTISSLHHQFAACFLLHLLVATDVLLALYSNS